MVGTNEEFGVLAIFVLRTLNLFRIYFSQDDESQFVERARVLSNESDFSRTSNCIGRSSSLAVLPLSSIMYNGIGLVTVRGSGTNGFVQRNLGFIKNKKDHIAYKTDEELDKLETLMTKKPNREILDHQRKRQLELKCIEMQELMEEQGYDEEEIERKVRPLGMLVIGAYVCVCARERVCLFVGEF